MKDLVINGLQRGYTAYHVVDVCKEFLSAQGYSELSEQQEWTLEQNKGYFVARGGSSLIAFYVGDLQNYRFKIVSSHTDSPAIKVKYNPVMAVGNSLKLNVETYGGGIWATFTDVPLALAGRLVVKKGGKISSKTFTDEHTFVIPNMAIHMNRQANDGFKYNPQVDLSPLFGCVGEENYLQTVCAEGEELVGYDLFLVNKTAPFTAGVGNEYLCSGRLDNQVSAYSSIQALASSHGDGVCLAFLADNEEVGSRSNEGADSDFLRKVMARINRALGKSEEQFDVAVSKSFVVSADNAHATHPNHPELSDPTNKVVMGGGMVIKHHANRNYTTTGLTAGAFSDLLQAKGVKVQNFFMRADLRCGSTLGAISSSQISIASVDVGAPQLAMHSSLETMAVADVDSYVDGMTVFYDSRLCVNPDGSMGW